jgi:hypothetical protein
MSIANIEDATGVSGQVSEKLEEALTEGGGLAEFIANLHSVMNSETSGHACTLHDELAELLEQAKDKADTLTGCLASLRV